MSGLGSSGSGIPHPSIWDTYVLPAAAFLNYMLPIGEAVQVALWLLPAMGAAGIVSMVTHGFALRPTEAAWWRDLLYVFQKFVVDASLSGLKTSGSGISWADGVGARGASARVRLT